MDGVCSKDWCKESRYCADPFETTLTSAGLGLNRARTYFGLFTTLSFLLTHLKIFIFNTQKHTHLGEMHCFFI